MASFITWKKKQQKTKSHKASGQNPWLQAGAKGACIHYFSRNHTSLQNDLTQISTVLFPYKMASCSSVQQSWILSIPTADILACQVSWCACKGSTVSHKCNEEVGQPPPSNTASMFTDSGCPSLTISCSVASAPQQRSSGRCSSSSGGCSTHGPDEVRLEKTWPRPCVPSFSAGEVKCKHLLTSPYLRPVVTGSICKDVAIVVEAAGRDGLVELLRGLQLGPGVFVPEAETAIWAHCGQRAVDRMERNSIHLMGQQGR